MFIVTIQVQTRMQEGAMNAYRYHELVALLQPASSDAKTSPQQCLANFNTNLLLSYRLRVTALISSGYRATVESLSRVRSSSASTSLDAYWTCRVGKLRFKAFFHIW